MFAKWCFALSARSWNLIGQLVLTADVIDVYSIENGVMDAAEILKMKALNVEISVRRVVCCTLQLLDEGGLSEFSTKQSDNILPSWH